MKILLVPLDDRPSSWQFPQKMGEIGDVDVVLPPRALWGRFMEPGQSDRIVSWIRSQDLSTYDAAIVAVDMLAYGGLVGSRTYQVSSSAALRRIRVLEEMRSKAPGLKIYAQNVIMRLALTYDRENAAYYSKFSEWAKISASTDAASRQRTAEFEKEIPGHILKNYLRARKRNLQSNLAAIRLVKKGVVDFLILSQDDASPVGIHVADREKLKQAIKELGVTSKVAIQPGADEVSMLLLARALNTFHHQRTAVKAIYCSEEKANTVMPYEDVPLRETVSHHLAAAGASEVQDEEEADLLFFVFASRDVAGRAETFVEEIARYVEQGKRVAVADVDPIGNIQGGDETFTSLLIREGLMPRLSGYASWNTAGNTIGTVLPQGLIFTLTDSRLMTDPATSRKVMAAHRWFTLHRVMDDYYYHNLVRKKTQGYMKAEGLGSLIMDEEQARGVEQYARTLMHDFFDGFTETFFRDVATEKQQIHCKCIGDIRFSLPWNRTFEAEIDFDIECALN
ncbi:DUF4127 family protein [Parapedobacter soli]|uniref:DUF4127 family protein n=1 Tax=Parapedobacter soli TaxID=416955 RepID=UPI0021C80201|nr:DUF4127 family protein [Parapedobacter soli]